MRRLLPVVACAALVLAACGGGSSPGGQQEQGPIKIGAIFPLTGNYQPLGTEDKKGAELAIRQINESGGINGRQVELIIKNDKTKPDQSVIAYNELKGQDVAGVIGSSFSNCALAVEPIAQRDKMPIISVSASVEQVQPIKSYVFMVPGTSVQYAESLLQYFQAQGMNEIAVAYDTQSSYAVTGFNATKDLASEYGIDLVTTEEFQTSTGDFSAVFSHVRDSGAQGLLVWATGAPAVVATKQFDSAGMDMPLIMTGAEASKLYTDPAGEAANGVILNSSVSVVGPHLPESELKDVVTAMAEPFQQKHGYYPPQFAGDAYTAVKLMAAAIEKAGSTDDEAIQQALENLTLLTPNGEYSYGPDDHSGLDLSAISVNEIQDGEIVPTEWGQRQLQKNYGSQ